MLHAAGVRPGSRVLDFGCGCGRTIRYLTPGAWTISGCDVDEEAIAWCRANLAGNYLRTDAVPPLPYMNDEFHAAYAISVFTHLPTADQRSWAAELARIVAPRGVLIITTVGDFALGSYPARATSANREQLGTDGVLFFPAAGNFNASAAFHTAAGIEQLFGRWFAIEDYRVGGLDRFQDLTVLLRR